eukprot:TRINITY_DN82697_c0_g1_i1.p1 TRINITY_DN82697_c0_g1~~TRINITY_DN82697_c0_g1_i1.p1  ORF type:complete len:471 (-),score=181.38 TRINITY_DN82697_c0_g1_i1:144-1406(-)
MLALMQEYASDALIIREALDALGSLAASGDRLQLKALLDNKVSGSVVDAMRQHMGKGSESNFLDDEEKEQNAKAAENDEGEESEEEKDDDKDEEEEDDDDDEEEDTETRPPKLSPEEEEMKRAKAALEEKAKGKRQQAARELKSMEFLQKEMDCREVLKAACGAFERLARYGNEALRAQVIEAKAASSIVAAMELHYRDHGVQLAASLALRSLVRWRPGIVKWLPRLTGEVDREDDEEKAKDIAKKLDKEDAGAAVLQSSIAALLRALDPLHGQDQLEVNKQGRTKERAQREGIAVDEDPVDIKELQTEVLLTLKEFAMYGSGKIKDMMRQQFTAEEKRLKRPVGGEANKIVFEDLRLAEERTAERARKKKEAQEAAKAAAKEARLAAGGGSEDEEDDDDDDGDDDGDMDDMDDMDDDDE